MQLQTIIWTSVDLLLFIIIKPMRSNLSEIKKNEWNISFHEKNV